MADKKSKLLEYVQELMLIWIILMLATFNYLHDAETINVNKLDKNKEVMMTANTFWNLAPHNRRLFLVEDTVFEYDDFVKFCRNHTKLRMIEAEDPA